MGLSTQRTLGRSARDLWLATSTYALRVFVRMVPSEQQRVFALTLLIGGVCGVVAVSFHSALRLAESLWINRALDLPAESWIPWTLAVPTLGALLSGLLLHYVVPEARGSGIPQVKYIFAVTSGRVSLRDAIGKFVVGILQIGSGSSLGREGPTVHICAGIASTLGRLFAISPRNMRRLIPVGSAAGIAAAFNAPIAAVTFTIEEIVGGLDQTLLSGVVVAAALSAVIERGVLGEHPVFNVPGDYGLDHASSLAVYAAIGVAAALTSQVFHTGLLRTRATVRGMGILPEWAKPALGGFATGALAVVALLTLNTRGITGDGYGTLSVALAGNLAMTPMIVLAIGKLAATVLCYGTGGAGGIFAPVLFIGGMIGGSFGHLDSWLLSHANADLGAFALVGMGAFFAAVIRAPITSVLIIFEMTGSYGLILPLMIANSVAFVFARRMQPIPIYEALLEQDGLHLPATQRAATVISTLRVADAMTTVVTTLKHDLTVRDAIAQIEGLPYTMYPVVDSERRLIGVVTESRLRRRLAEDRGADLVGDHARVEQYLRAETSLVDAVVRMNKLAARQMVVVQDRDGTHVAGMLAMSDVMRAHASAALANEDPDLPNERASQRSAVRWDLRDSSRPSDSDPPYPPPDRTDER